MTDEDVRDMLAERARSIRPATDGLAKIEARLAGVPVAPRRRLPMSMLAAAAVTVMAMVGATVFVQRDDETSVDSGTFTTAPDAPPTTDTTQPAKTELPPGVWPFPQDEVAEAALGDPVDTALAYVDARVGGTTDRTTVSEYQAGDNSSGEVVFGGDIQTTVFVRRLDDRWHVEGSASDLVTLHDADGDGSLTAVVEAKGWLQSHVALSTGASQPLVEAREFDAGEEITEGLAYDLNTDQAVKAVRFLLTFGPEGTKGLSEVAFRPPFAETAVPDGAVWQEAGLDARELVVAYLDDRLDGRRVEVGDLTEVGDGSGEVTWEAGVVRLQQLDGYWYVVEAIGDSIQIAGTSLDAGYVGGTLTLAQAGTVRLSVGDTAWDVRNDVDAEGTDVPFEHEVPTDAPVILRAVFETDSGFVSLAERVIG